MINIVLGKSTLITVTFHEFRDDTDTGGPVDPDFVYGYVRAAPEPITIGEDDSATFDEDDAQEPRYLDSGAVVLDFTSFIQHDGLGVYSYIWTPTDAGSFVIEFDGFYVVDNSHDIIAEEFEVTEDAETFFFQNKLGEDQYLQLMPTLDNVFIDPEDIHAYFPDASMMDIVGLIHLFSVEAQQLMGPDNQDITKWNMVAFDYIQAATLCSLSKMYGFGDADLTSIKLGDLEVTNQRFGRTSINRTTAVTWCEIAGALRAEMIADSGRQNFRAIVKGSRFTNPIPRRHLRPFERGRQS